MWRLRRRRRELDIAIEAGRRRDRGRCDLPELATPTGRLALIAKAWRDQWAVRSINVSLTERGAGLTRVARTVGHIPADTNGAAGARVHDEVAAGAGLAARLHLRE